MSVRTYTDLKAGDEIFTYYGYKGATFPGDFPWYFEAKALIEREERLKQEELAKTKTKKSRKDSGKAKKKRKS